MIEEFICEGIWSVIDGQREKLCGTLKFAPDSGATLTLLGSTSVIDSISKTLYSKGGADGIPYQEIILGNSLNKRVITLFNCILTGNSSNYPDPGPSTLSFMVNIVFDGTLFTKKEDIKFCTLSVRFTNLDEWANISGSDLHEPIRVIKQDDYEISIEFTRPLYAHMQNDAYITQNAWVTIKSTAEKTLEEYKKIIKKIENLLTLFIIMPVYPLQITGTTKNNNRPVEIFYRIPNYNKKSVVWPQMLVSYKEISDRFENLVKNWFEKEELLEPVYILYFDTLYNPSMNVLHRFLSYVQAIETYHRRFKKNCELPEEEHEKRITEISEAVQKHKKWLEGKLKYSNEPNLQKRLLDILDEYSQITDLFIEPKRRGIITQKIVDSRNYYTHGNLKLKTLAADWEELTCLQYKLKMLLEICLLNELGFSITEIRRSMVKNELYKQQIPYLRRDCPGSITFI